MVSYPGGQGFRCIILGSGLRLMHFVQMVPNFDKMSLQINHDLQDADGV